MKVHSIAPIRGVDERIFDTETGIYYDLTNQGQQGKKVRAGIIGGAEGTFFYNDAADTIWAVVSTDVRTIAAELFNVTNQIVEILEAQEDVPRSLLGEARDILDDAETLPQDRIALVLKKLYDLQTNSFSAKHPSLMIFSDGSGRIEYDLEERHFDSYRDMLDTLEKIK